MRLSDVCLSVAYIGPKSRTERPRKTKVGTEGAHVTRDSDTTFKVKGQGHQAALLTAVLARQAAAVVGVRTCWPWETAATLPSSRRRKGLQRPRGGGEDRGGSYRGGRPPTACCLTRVTIYQQHYSCETCFPLEPSPLGGAAINTQMMDGSSCQIWYPCQTSALPLCHDKVAVPMF